MEDEVQDQAAPWVRVGGNTHHNTENACGTVHILKQEARRTQRVSENLVFLAEAGNT